MNATTEKFTKKKGVIASVKQLLQQCRKKHDILTEGELQFRGGCVRIPCSGTVVEVCLGGAVGKTLHLQPDILPETEKSGSNPWPSYWVVDMERISQGLGGFMRLEPKQDIVLGRYSPEQSGMFDYSTQVGHRHLSIVHLGEFLQLTDLGSEGGSCVRILTTTEQCLATVRQSQLQKLSELFFQFTSADTPPHAPDEAPFHRRITQPLPSDEAMERLLQAHHVIRTAFLSSVPCSFADLSPTEGETVDESILDPPTLVHLSADTIPIVVGDLHAKVDNLLTLLTTGNVITSLEEGIATLVFLGDAVHPDEDKQLTEMEGSMLMMDLILTLMVRFPGRVVYLRGNHDGFSEDIYKGNICQGQCWSRALIQTRGKDYRAAMKAFYRDLPYVVVHPRLLATHAAPPVAKVTREMLTAMRDNHPQLIHQLTWNRMHQSTRPGGYREKDIQNFRQLFDLPKDTSFVVGHTPMDHKNTAWFNAGGMANHHVLYSGLLERVGWMISFPNVLVHLECPVCHQPGMVR